MSDHAVTRRATTVRLPEYMLLHLSSEARRQGISVSHFVENVMEEYLYQQPNPETLAAIEEARSGAEMEELTEYEIEHFDEFVASL